jgi:hypothetical protein
MDPDMVKMNGSPELYLVSKGFQSYILLPALVERLQAAGGRAAARPVSEPASTLSKKKRRKMLPKFSTMILA